MTEIFFSSHHEISVYGEFFELHNLNMEFALSLKVDVEKSRIKIKIQLADT